MVNVKPVTLYDVAEYAGVSYQTVSRVVNQACHVSAKTREKVEAAMAELNYIPNRVAQQLAGKQSLLIGVATSSLALHAPSQIVAAIKSRADQLGASVVVSMVERSGVEACKAALAKEYKAQVKQLIEMNRIIIANGDIGFNFTDGNLIKKIFVDKLTQTQLINGRLAIARLLVDNNSEGEYAIIPASVADKIAQRDASSIVLHSALSAEEQDEDDPYADFKVPDDLMW